MGLLDQAKEFASSDQGKSLINQAKNSFGNSNSSENKLDQGRSDQRGVSGRNNDNDDYLSSDRQAQPNYDDSYSGNNDNEYGRSNRQGQSGAYDDSDRNRSDGVDQDFGARGGVSARDGGDNFGSVGSGGYGTNNQGDSFSARNQSGFDNEQNDFAPRDY